MEKQKLLSKLFVKGLLLKLIVFIGLSVCLPAAYAQDVQRTVFVHLFEWCWDDIAKECENFLGPKGFAAVQVSPPNEHRLVPNYPWWQRYQPVSYQLVSRSGNRQEFEEMVRRCNAVGVDIYADAVINHMTGSRFANDSLFGRGSANSSYSYYDYPAFKSGNFHDCRRDITDYNNVWEVQNCNLVGLADLNTEQDYVQQTIANYLNDLINIGVAGFRIDAAKHMSPWDIRGILSKVHRDPLVFQEVIEGPGEPVQGQEYFQNGLVTEFDYGKNISQFFRSGPLVALRTFGDSWAELMPSHRAVVFIDNHDNQRGHGGAGNVISHKDGRLYDLANFFMMAWPYGYPKIMSSYTFNNTDEGPPSMNGQTKRVYDGNQLNCFGEWKCEHRWLPIANMVAFRNHTIDSWGVSNWWDNGSNQIAFGRGNKGFVVINKESSQLVKTLQTGLPPGDYCNTWDSEITDGECSGTTIAVYPDGTASFNVPPWTGAAIHVGFRPEQAPEPEPGPKPCVGENCWKRTVVFVYGVTYSGQDMFIRGGIDHGYANTVLQKNCSNSNMNCAIPIRHRNLKNNTTAPWKNGDIHLDWYGKEDGQNEQSHGIIAVGTPLDWTTDKWPSNWGHKRTVSEDGFGEEMLNKYGQHYWMLDVDMDCSKTVDGWFELKSYISNGPGWEGDIRQPDAPYSSKNHFARCGYVNVYKRGENKPVSMYPLP